MNKAILIGRLTSDAEIKYFGDSRPVLKFRIAVDRNYVNANNEKETDFLSISYWTEHAEKLQPYLTKGRMVGVTGSIRINTVESQDGTKKYFTEINCSELQLLDSPREKQA